MKTVSGSGIPILKGVTPQVVYSGTFSLFVKCDVKSNFTKAYLREIETNVSIALPGFPVVNTDSFSLNVSDLTLGNWGIYIVHESGFHPR
jgi:hypothetical protein